MSEPSLARGAAWTVAARVLERAFGFLSLLLLARLLVPSEFGVVAMASSIIAAVEIFGAFGFDWAIVRHSNPSRRLFDTAWTLRVCVATASALLLLLLAHPVATYFRDERLSLVVCVLAFGTFIDGFENIGMAYFRREMRFDREVVQLTAARVAAIAVSLPIAWFTRSYWALIAGALASKSVRLAASYLLHPFRPRFSLAERRELFGFSLWLQLSNIAQTIRDRASDFVLGRSVGPHGVAIYAMSYELGHLATTEIAAPTNRAVFSNYARMEGDASRIGAGFLQVASLLWLIALPVAAGIACVAHEIVMLLLGPNWSDAPAVLRLLALGGLAAVMAANIQYVFLAMGKPRINTLVLLAGLAIQLPLLILLAARMGVVGAAWAYVIAAWSILPLVFGLLRATIQIRAMRFAREVWRAVTATLAMVAVVLASLPDTPAADSLSAARDLLMLVPLGAFVFAGTIYLTWRLSGKPSGAETLLTSLVARTISSVSGVFLKRRHS